MATVERIRKLSCVGDVQNHPSLSAYETRCLCSRLADCEEVVQQAFVGACEARIKTGDAPELVRICQALEVSLQQIAMAKQLGH